MPKALCILGMVVAALVVLVFLLDLALGVPFYGVSKLLDIVFVICGAILGYLSWATMKEQV
jgi:hypothetical protein